MKATYKSDHYGNGSWPVYELDSGRVIDAYKHIIGISPDEDKIYDYDDELVIWDEEHGDLTMEERKEIAAFMILVWTKWANLPPR